MTDPTTPGEGLDPGTTLPMFPLGSVLLPIPVVGTFAGALVGGVLGSEVGKTVGSALLDGISSFTESLSGASQPKDKDDTPS